MTYLHGPTSTETPTLPNSWLRLLFERTQDLTLLIDDKAIVVDAFQSGSFSAEDLAGGVGPPLRSIVGPESVAKIDVLLANDLSLAASDARWRHINLRGSGQIFIPVLARYLVLRSDVQEVKSVILRDLRTLQAANDRFAEARRELEFEYSEALRLLDRKNHKPNRSGDGSISIEQVLGQIGNSSLDKVITETAASLERRCLMVILQEAGGKHTVAARVAKLPLEAWMDMIQRHNLGS